MENDKPKARFNIFDVILILLIVGTVGAVAVRAYFTANAKDRFVSADVEFTVVGVSDFTADALSVNQPVYLAENDHHIGQIRELTVIPSEIQVEDAEGKLITLSHPEKKDVRGTASLSGIFTDDGFMIDGKYLAAAGKTVSVYTNGATCIFTVRKVIPAE